MGILDFFKRKSTRAASSEDSTRQFIEELRSLSPAEQARRLGEEAVKNLRHAAAIAKKEELAHQTPPLHFKDGLAAFEYSCQFMDCQLQEGSNLPALVLDPRQVLGAKTAIQIQKDGNQVAMLRVASSDGGFIVFAVTLGPKGPKLQPGDLVAWRAAKHSDEVAASMSARDKRSGWVGLIIGTLKPEHRNGQWVGDVRFAP